MKTLEEILKKGIKENDWTYCKAEYAPKEGCKVGMPKESTPNGTKKDGVKTCYIVTAKFRSGEISTHTDMMYLSDGKFYWHDNLWHDDDVVDQEISGDWWLEPIAWIEYKNLPDADISLPIAPCNRDAVKTPEHQKE